MKNNDQLGQDEKYMNQVLDNSVDKFKIIFNNKRFQQMKQGINTCGRWIILRYIMLRDYNMDLKQFIKFINDLKKQYKKPLDYIVSEIVI